MGEKEDGDKEVIVLLHFLNAGYYVVDATGTQTIQIQEGLGQVPQFIYFILQVC